MNDEDHVPLYNWALQTNVAEPYAFCSMAFTPAECDLISAMGQKSYLHKGKLYDNEDINNDNLNEYRRSTISFIQANQKDHIWLFQKLTDISLSINSQFFNFDVDEIQTLQYGEYDSADLGFYTKHVDMLYKSGKVRKLSFSLQLTDEKEYDGGDLLLHYSSTPITIDRTQGTIIFFPSYALHEVTPVTRGTRRSLVGWITGPAFK